MIPIRDDNPTVLTPWATLTIVALTAAVWILVQGMGTEPTLTGSVCRYGLIPGELLQLVTPGTRLPVGPGMVCVLTDQAAWYTMLTSMFMHGGWMHIIGNMWFLWIFGGNVEDAMGSARFAVFYVLCGIAAAAVQMLADTASPIPMVGASGAIGGVMGAYIVLYPRVHVHMLVIFGFYVTTFAVPAIWMLGYWIGLQLLGGLMSAGSGGGVAFWAHVGGFVAGAVLVALFKNDRLLAAHPYHGWKQHRHATRAWQRVNRRR